MMIFRPKSRCYMSFPRTRLPANKFSDDNLSGHELQEGPIEDNGTRFWSGVQ
jgi:hypothetical protein